MRMSVLTTRTKSAPNVPGATEAERFDNAVRSIFKVSKESLLKEETKLKSEKKRAKKRTKKTG